MKKVERISWPLLLVGLIILELWMIVWNNQDVERSRQYAQCKEQQHFSETASGISKEIKTFTGGHSYLVLYYVPGQPRLYFFQKGDYSVFDARARITDLNAIKAHDRFEDMLGTTVNVGEVPKGRVAQETVPPELDKKENAANLNIFFTARNGGWTEQFRIRRKTGGWTYAIRVVGIFSDLKKSKVVCESIAKDFPIGTLDKDFDRFPRNPKLPQCFP